MCSMQTGAHEDLKPDTQSDHTAPIQEADCQTTTITNHFPPGRHSSGERPACCSPAAPRRPKGR